LPGGIGTGCVGVITEWTSSEATPQGVATTENPLMLGGAVPPAFCP
jgi:hypothetical protein